MRLLSKNASLAEPGFRLDLQGLRAIAVLLVVLSHAGVSTFAGGFVGVDVWGRATVRNALGGEVEVSPEQASIRAADDGADN